MKKLIIIIVSILFSMSNGIAQTTIAIIDFDARDISASEVATLTDRFRDELTKTKQYIVIERGKMEEVLREQGFQQSGCSSDECVVEVGQLIGVQQMVGGSIGKVGNVFTLSARIIDVESGTILNVTNYDHLGDISGLLTVGMRNAVQQLLEGKSTRLESEVVKSNEYTTPSVSKQTEPEPELYNDWIEMDTTTLLLEPEPELYNDWIEMDTTTLLLEPEPNYTPHDLLQLGRFVEAARIWEIQKGTTPKNYTIVLLVACQDGTINAAYRALNQPPDFFILPKTVKGQACYAVCWGDFASKRDAKRRLKEVPKWFKRSSGKPSVYMLGDL